MTDHPRPPKLRERSRKTVAQPDARCRELEFTESHPHFPKPVRTIITLRNGLPAVRPEFLRPGGVGQSLQRALGRPSRNSVFSPSGFHMGGLGGC